MKRIIYLILFVAFSPCKSKKPIVAEKTLKIKTTKELKHKFEIKSIPTVIDKPEVNSRYVKLDVLDVDVDKQNRAFDLGKRLLETCNTSKFNSFTSDEATEKVRQNATVETISKTCRKILIRNGKFIDLELLEITFDTQTEDLLFIYNIEYEKKYFERQLNVTVNSEGKVSAMSTKELPKKPM